MNGPHFAVFAKRGNRKRTILYRVGNYDGAFLPLNSKQICGKTTKKEPRPQWLEASEVTE